MAGSFSRDFLKSSVKQSVSTNTTLEVRHCAVSVFMVLVPPAVPSLARLADADAENAPLEATLTSTPAEVAIPRVKEIAEVYELEAEEKAQDSVGLASI